MLLLLREDVHNMVFVGGETKERIMRDLFLDLLRKVGTKAIKKQDHYSVTIILNKDQAKDVLLEEVLVLVTPV